MMLYPLLIFAHVLGAVGIFTAIGIEGVSLGRLRLADTPAEARASMRALPMRLGPIAMLTTLASGMWMMATSWGPEPWIVSGFVGIVAMGVVGGVLSQRRIRRLRVALAAETGPALSDAFRSARSSAALTASLRLRIAIGIGILGLMTIKPPDVTTASVILAVAVVAGLVAIIPFATRRLPLAERSEA
jgi:hypothetical protein